MQILIIKMAAKEATLEDLENCKYTDLVKCTCNGDIDLHFEMNPHLTTNPKRFFANFYWCTERGKQELMSKLDSMIEQKKKNMTENQMGDLSLSEKIDEIK